MTPERVKELSARVIGVAADISRNSVSGNKHPAPRKTLTRLNWQFNIFINKNNVPI
jgi:hypothetical protein